MTEAGRGFNEEQPFEHFGPLLQVCADYALHTGFRFRSRDFRNLEALQAELVRLPPEEARAEEANFAARMRAKPMVCHFAARLRAGDCWLDGELEHAMRVQLLEGARNAMICTCRELGLFPPSCQDVDDGASFEDVSAPLEVIAQRLYSEGKRNSTCNSAKTSSFLADFATEEGAVLPEKMSEGYQALMHEFSARVSEWKQQQQKAPAASAAASEEAEEASLAKFGRELLVETQTLGEEVQAALGLKKASGIAGWAGALRQGVQNWADTLSC
jgi:hypothetical protein